MRPYLRKVCRPRQGSRAISLVWRWTRKQGRSRVPPQLPEMRDEKVQNALDLSDELFRLLVESVSDYAIFILDPKGNIVSWNPGAQRLKGYTREEILGKHFSIFYPEEDKATPPWELKVATQEGRVAVEGWRLRKDGTRFWAAVVITAMRNKSGQLIGFAKVTRDLTERKESEERLRASEEQFRKLVESVDEYAIYLLDPNGNVKTWNAGAQKIKHYKGAEIIGKNFASFYTAEDVAAGIPERNLKQAARLGHVRDQGLRVRKDGTTFHADVVLTALRDDDGNLRGFSKVTRDMTDQVRNRETEAAKIAAEKANQAKDDFLAALSHELRTPLTPALAAASFLAHNSDKLPADMSEEVDTIRRNVQLEARLIDDLLDLTRITRGKIELRFERVDAHALPRKRSRLPGPDSDAKNLQISLSLKAQNHHVWADPIRIQQVFWNLINNAVKFTPARGKIEIATRNSGDGPHFGSARQRDWNRCQSSEVALQPFRAGRSFRDPPIRRPGSGIGHLKTSDGFA